MEWSVLTTYGELGLRHILDFSGLDHILFVLSLCARFTFKQWKRMAWLITAFTIGHSLTLAVAVYYGALLPAELVETLIPITIIISCLVNVAQPKPKRVLWLSYVVTLLFGFIHGMGFSNYLLALLRDSEAVLLPLLSFNLGLEIGQIAIVMLSLLLITLIMGFTRLKLVEWTKAISIFIMGMAVMMM